MRAAAAAVPALLIALSACALGAPGAPPQPAVLVAPDAAARAELVAAISRELHAALTIRLADDALEHASDLLIDRAMPRDESGRLLEGRERGRPQHFRLWLVDGHCVLEHQGGSRVRLHNARCARAPG